MSIIKKILFCLVFLYISFFLFKNDIFAEGYCFSSYSSTCNDPGYTWQSTHYGCQFPYGHYCSFTGCHGNNGTNYDAGTTHIKHEACYNSYSYGGCSPSTSLYESAPKSDPSPLKGTANCYWDDTSYCDCPDSGGTLQQRHNGCSGYDLGCNTVNGWYDSCEKAGGGICKRSMNYCATCGNDSIWCFKSTGIIHTDECSSDAICGSCQYCKNPLANNSTCEPDPSCGTVPSGCSTPANGDCANAGGTCSTNAIANTTTQSGLCGGGDTCLCRIPIAPSFVCEPENSDDAITCATFGGKCDDPDNYSNPEYLSNLCTGAAKCRCVKGCTSNCSAKGDYCSGQTFSDGCSGTCTGTKQPDCSGASNFCSGTTYDATCGTCNGTKAVVANDIGTCGTADTSGATYSSAPSGSVLCADSDTASAVSISTNTYSWNCTGVAGTCVAAQTLTLPCSAIRDNPPTFVSIDIRNNNDASISTENGDSNHICQSLFTSTAKPTTARFVVTYHDDQEGSDINIINLRLGSTTFVPGSIVSVGKNTVATFNISTSQIASTDLQRIYTSASDVHVYSGSSSEIATSRKFKYWDCSVSASGTGYDGSATGGLCSNSESFLTPVSIGYSLIMNDVGPGAGTDKSMIVNSPTYSSGSNSLVWGREYNFDISDFDGSDPLQIRLKGNTCSNIQFTLNNSVADPYVSPVSFIADFSSVLDQDPWWQAVGGGAISNTSLNNRVPVTCITANCKISQNALVAAPSINNTGRSPNNGDAQTWYYGSTSGLSNNSAKLAVNNTNYSYFLNQYHDRNGVGTVLSGNKTVTKIEDFDSDPNNIFFIDGNLTIDGNIIKTGNFLMIIVNGDITVANNVNQVDGILVAKNIIASGNTNNTQLQFNGSLYASNNIDFSRGYRIKRDNNASPAVVVNHNPQMIFNLPGSLAKVLTNWQWGN